MALILPNTIQNAIPADGDKLGQNYATIVDWANQEAITRDGSTAMTGALLLPGAPTQPNQAATKSYVDSFLPPGVMFQYGGVTEPAGWMFCRGQAISRATYSALYSVVGDRFGVGNGATTFNLPDMRGRYPIGHNEGGTYMSVGVGEKYGNKDAVIVDHTHNMHEHTHGVNINTGTESTSHTHGTGQAGQDFLTIGSGLGPASSGAGVYNRTTLTGTQSVLHTHNVQGTTGATNWNTTDPVNEATGSATNANLPPSTSFNFIMKVT